MQSKSMDENKMFIVFAGSSCKEFVNTICHDLNINPGQLICGSLLNGEIHVEITESVRGADVFLVQTGANPINDNLMELLVMIHSCKFASANKVTAVIPCYPYSRQDKKDRSRAPVSAKLVADLLTQAGADQIITMDLHASQTQGFFDVPVENLVAEPLFVDWIIKNVPNYKSAVLISPDVGGAKRVASIADFLQMEFALIHKHHKVDDHFSEMIIVGSISGKDIIMVDDMADTCGTVLKATEKLKEAGALKIYVLCVHGIFSGDALEKIQGSNIDTFIVTNTIDNTKRLKGMIKVIQIDVAPTFAEAIRRVEYKESISHLFSRPCYKKSST